MKILARATVVGQVEGFNAEAGTLNVAGLQIHTRHGAVVATGDFIELAATLGMDRVWTGEITAHFAAGSPAATLTSAPRPVASTSSAPATGPAASPKDGAGSGTAAQAPSAAAPGPAASVSTGSQAPSAPAQQPQSAASQPATSRSARFGQQRSNGGAPTAASSGQERPGASSPPASSRPPFVASAADRQVQY